MKVALVNDPEPMNTSAPSEITPHSGKNGKIFLKHAFLKEIFRQWEVQERTDWSKIAI